ncbi:MAG: thioredoxin-dependent thiol peroxidase [Bacteroidales bacterium]|nr:thioredoxin-dependent thiol peroxidase [Bacteroidales bacterium]
MKNVGDKVQDLLGVDADGKEIRLSDYPGKKVALYFYPKDNTPGCSAEACSLRDGYEDLLKAGYQVIGASVDAPASHKKFIEKYNLPFPLITDADHHLVEEFGVWGEKKLAGRQYMGTFRTTFIIGPDGVIERVFTPKEVKTKIHASQILDSSKA